MTSVRAMPNEELRRQWAAALAADVGPWTHEELGRRLVELAREIDRRVALGARDLLPPRRGDVGRLRRRSVAPEAGALRVYIARRATAPAAAAPEQPAGTTAAAAEQPTTLAG